MKIVSLILIFSILVLFTACIHANNSTSLSGIEIPLSEMNQELYLYAPTESNLFTIGKDFAIVIENLSGSPIIISSNEVSVYEKTDSY